MLMSIVAWLRQREAVRELSLLSDRELADFGMVRSDIKSVAAHAARQAVEANVASRGDTMAPSWASHNRRSLAV